MMDITMMTEQTLELTRDVELNSNDLIPKGQSSNRKTLTTREPLLGYKTDTYITPVFNQLADCNGVNRVACAKNDLKKVIGRPAKGRTEMKPADISRYNNPNATMILPKMNNLFPTQPSTFPAY